MDLVLRVALHEIDQLDTDCGIEIEYRINMRRTDRVQRAIDTPSGKRRSKIMILIVFKYTNPLGPLLSYRSFVMLASFVVSCHLC